MKHRNINNKLIYTKKLYLFIVFVSVYFFMGGCYYSAMQTDFYSTKKIDKNSIVGKHKSEIITLLGLPVQSVSVISDSNIIEYRWFYKNTEDKYTIYFSSNYIAKKIETGHKLCIP